MTTLRYLSGGDLHTGVWRTWGCCRLGYRHLTVAVAHVSRSPNRSTVIIGSFCTSDTQHSLWLSVCLYGRHVASLQTVLLVVSGCWKVGYICCFL